MATESDGLKSRELSSGGDRLGSVGGDGLRGGGGNGLGPGSGGRLRLGGSYLLGDRRMVQGDMTVIISDVTAVIGSDVKAAINSDWGVIIKSNLMGLLGLATESTTAEVVIEVDKVLVEADIVSTIEDRTVDGQRPIAKQQQE